MCVLGIFFYTLKRVLAKGKQKYVEKKEEISLVARPCEEDSRRKEARGADPVNIRGVLTLLF